MRRLLLVFDCMTSFALNANTFGVRGDVMDVGVRPGLPVGFF